MSAELERALDELRVEWPDTPDVAGAIAGRLEHAPRPRPVRAPRWRPAIAVALALVIALGAAMAVEPARSAILDFLGFGAVRIEQREPSVAPGRLGAGLELGQPVTLEQARREAGFPVSVPAELGAPDAVFLDRIAPGGPRVTLTYAPRAGLPRADPTGVGLVVTELRGRTSEGILKVVGKGTTLERFEVAGDPAMFLSGDPHGVVFEPASGETVFEQDRMAADVLLVDRPDGVLVRLEGRMTRATAARIAASMR